MAIDLLVNPPNSAALDDFARMSRLLGFAGFGTTLQLSDYLVELSSAVKAISRIDISGKNIRSMKKQIVQFRRNFVIMAVPLGLARVTNRLADDHRVDLLTLPPRGSNNLFRGSTASIAADAGTALEIPLLPLLEMTGLQRSKIIKFYRTAIDVAVANEMNVVLSSHAPRPILMRSPSAIRYIGTILNLSPDEAQHSTSTIPDEIVRRNLNRLQPEHIADGIDVVEWGTEH